MSTFTALNIDYAAPGAAAVSDEDTTKELQTEEALKLYQTALKLHAEGPSSYNAAEIAYQELFASEIFKYAEAKSEFSRSRDFPEYEEMWIENAVVAASATTAGAVAASGEGAPNTLAQLVHLSWKNYGRFLLDMLQERVREHLRISPAVEIKREDVAETSKQPLEAYAEALDKDDTDIEIWRSTAAVAQLVGCNRIARFCLEAVLDMGEESLDDVLGIPNLDQTLAMSKLQDMVKRLQDDVAASLAPLSTARRQKLGEALVRQLETHSAIPRPSIEESTYSAEARTGASPVRYTMRAQKRDWTAVGEAIIQLQMLIDSEQVKGSGLAFGVEIPDGSVEPEPEDVHMSLPERPLPSTLEAAKTDETAKPRNDGPDTVEINDNEAEDDLKNAGAPEPDPLPAAPSRKRSPESAELPEDDNRGRSKRTRHRDTETGGSKPDEAKINADWQLGIYLESDGWFNNATNVFLQKLGISELIPAADLRALVEDGSNSRKLGGDDMLKAAIRDFYDLTTGSAPEMVNILTNGVNGENIDSFGAASREAGLNAFLGRSSTRASQASLKPLLSAAGQLARWVDEVNKGWYCPKEAARNFLSTLLKPGCFPGVEQSSYVAHRWPEHLKRNVVQLAVRFDDDIYSLVEEQIMSMSNRELQAQCTGLRFELSSDDLNTTELVETLFELHLDVYSLIKRPGTTVDASIKMSQQDRLERWSSLANTAINLRNNGKDSGETDDLALRHIWATAFHISVCDDVSQSHVLHCMRDLQSLLIELGEPVIHLQNNAVIPEISMTAVDQELSKINMKDFFERIFREKAEEDEEPVETIESLLPLLEGTIGKSTGGEVTPEEQLLREAGNAAQQDPSPHEQMSKFLANSSWMLRLSLWQRLRQAYKVIDYPPMVVSCHLRSLELLVAEMLNGTSAATGEARKIELLRLLHLIAEFVHKLLQMHASCENMFECVDLEHLKSSITAITQVVQMIHSFNLYEDQVRVGAVPLPSFEGKPKPSFGTAVKWLHTLQIRCWMLLYRMFQEAIEQEPELFETPIDSKADYLRTLHYALGQRKICGEANRELLHLLLDEMLALSDSENSELELCQVVYDLYNLKFAAKPEDELMDHECTEPDVLTRKSALKLLGFFMSQARRVAMKDMPRHDIKGAIDRVQGALGKGKSTDDMLLNSRVYSYFMKSTLNPLDLFACLRGTFDIPTKPIPDTDAPVASKGWYFLLGLIALNKFKSVKRQGPGPTEDLMHAQAYFRQDIEFCSEHWESWYRLAQVNDLHLEEHISWSADKLNAHSHEIFHYQRNAIHAYMMATSAAVRCADGSTKTQALVAEMYADFGNRLYSSSREPFGMRAFHFQDKEERHMSGETLYQMPPFRPLTLFKAWRLACVMFKRSLVRVPENWLTHYMLGKCLWKMYTYAFPENSAELQHRPKKQEVIDCFVNAIKKMPKRDTRKDPTLEPHYKLVAIVHKLYKLGDLKRSEAQDLLQASSYAAKVSTGDEHDSWSEYLMSILKLLRSADKAGWHHRMTARAAHLAYDDSPSNPVSAMEAKHELTQQMFTKTMVLQVWKPELERPGRHFVYTTRYVQFFVQLLVQLGDRESMSALVKRLRKKPDQYFDHAKLWSDTCIIYLRLLRRIGNVAEGHEDTIFKSLNHEEFTQRSAKLEVWCHTATLSDKSLTYSVLTDVIELKKVNNGLMKATLIDDLLGDTYAKLYEEVGPDKLASINVPNKEGAPTPAAAAPSPPSAAPVVPKPMSLTNVMNVDGVTEAPPPPVPTLPEAPAPTKRVKLGVGRREIQRKAESCANKPVTTTAPARSMSISAATSTSNQAVQVVIPSPRVSSSKLPAQAAQGSTPLPATPFGRTMATTTTITTTDPATEATTKTVIESSDDSELSELDEEPEEPTQFSEPVRAFPNLIMRDSPAASSTTAREGEEEEEEGDDGGDEADEADGADEDGQEDGAEEEGEEGPNGIEVEDGDETVERDNSAEGERDADGDAKMGN